MQTPLGAEKGAMCCTPTEELNGSRSTEKDGEGVFLKPPAEDADEDAELELVSNIEDALPPGWEPVGGGN